MSMDTVRPHRILGIIAMAAAMLAPPARAVPIAYEGTVASGAPVTGSVSGDGWATETAAGVDFWRFAGTAGEVLELRATRLNSALDPVLTLYFGTTVADASLFLHDADWGGLVYLAIADDETPVAAGPGGDPALTGYLLPFTGLYTIAIGGFTSNGPGPFGYQMQLSAVPEPSVAVLLTSALGVLGVVSRRRRNGRRRADA